MTKLSEDTLVKKYIDNLDQQITKWMAKTGIKFLRIGLGIVFLWFGMLKFFVGLSPAEELVRHTVYFINPDLFIPILAAWESLIDIGLYLKDLADLV